MVKVICPHCKSVLVEYDGLTDAEIEAMIKDIKELHEVLG